MKTFFNTFLLLIFLNINSYAQAFIGKSYSEVYSIFQKYKGNQLNRYIEVNDNELSYGRTNDLKKQVIVMFNASFKNDYCFSEAWADIRTKEEAINRLRKSIGSKRLIYLSSSIEKGDCYLIDGWHTTLYAYIQYFDKPFKEYMVLIFEEN